jgi:hypothetical protein
MTTTENNKLIAEFMGFKLQQDTNERWFGQYFTTPNDSWTNRIELLHFHTDWNWLMPVVEKIEELGYDFDINKRENDNNVFIRGSQYSKTTSNKTKIEAVYNACVEFVKLYNLNK